MRNFKRIFSCFTAFILCFSLAACISGGGSGGKKKDGTEITIWIQAAAQPEYFMGWFEKAFEKEHSDIDLKFVPQDTSTLGAGLATSLKSKSGPDMSATWGGSLLPSLVDSNLVVNIDDIIDTDMESKMVNMSLYNKVDGKNFGAPIQGFASPVIFYNKTVFDQNSWAEPTTYAELVSVCNKVKAKSYSPVVTGYMPHIMQGLHARTMTDTELHALMADPATLSGNPYNEAGFKEGWNWLSRMFNDGIFASNISGYNVTTAENAFVSQKALMYSTTSLDLLRVSQQATFEIGCFVLPEAPEEFASAQPASKSISNVSGVYTDVMVINKNTEHADMCKKVIEFMYSKAAQEELFDCFLFPIMKDVSMENIDPNIKGVFDAAFKDLYATASGSGMTPFYMVYFDGLGMDANLESGFKGIYNGSMSIDQAIAACASLFDAVKK